MSGIGDGVGVGVTITSGDVSSLTFVYTNDPTDTFFTLPLSVIPTYGYILIPITLPQPIGFRDSNSGCDGNNIPTNNINTIIIIDGNGIPITYNTYRTFWPFTGDVDCWLCN